MSTAVPTFPDRIRDLTDFTGSLTDTYFLQYVQSLGKFQLTQVTKSLIGLGGVENTALSTWAGSTNLVTLGTVTTGVWHGTAVAAAYLPSLEGITAPAGDLSLNSHKITNLADPSSAQDAATKAYVDGVASGLTPKSAVLCATTANITLSGEQTIDGVTTSASRVLVKSQSTQAQNGIYLSGSGAWTRTSDMDAWAEVPSAFVFVEQGTVNADTGWTCTADPGGTLGTTAITWVQFSGAGTYTAGTGLTLSGGQFSISASYAGQTSIVTLGTVTTGTWNGTTIAIANGGTGQTTAANAINALVPSQTGNNGKYLTTNGSVVSWGTVTAGDVSTTAANTFTVGPQTVNIDDPAHNGLVIKSAASPSVAQGLFKDSSNNSRLEIVAPGTVTGNGNDFCGFRLFSQAGAVKWHIGDYDSAHGTDAFLIYANSNGGPHTWFLGAGGVLFTCGNSSNYTVADGVYPTSVGGWSTVTGYGDVMRVGVVVEEITLSTSGATTDSTANLLPANSEILGVVARVTQTITTATDWKLGDATTANRFSDANSTLAAGTTQVGLNHRQGGISTNAAGPVQTSAAKLRVTTTGTPGAGKIRVIVYYRQFVPPTV